MKPCFNVPQHDLCCLQDHLANCRISIRSSPADRISIVVVVTICGFPQGLASKIVCDVLRRPLTYSLSFMYTCSLAFRSA
ncbi:hypothetical protein HanPSC8_Chr16g0709561 [Helianthus annuus]|nr:hypothetical protein HanPSC8_Chr16g0709561 [Helianthus annuus]